MTVDAKDNREMKLRKKLCDYFGRLINPIA